MDRELKNLPSVSVDGQGEISVRGSTGFLVLVNGKPVLTDAQTVLSQLPANALENIELITVPSAKYDPGIRMTEKDHHGLLRNFYVSLSSSNLISQFFLPRFCQPLRF